MLLGLPSFGLPQESHRSKDRICVTAFSELQMLNHHCDAFIVTGLKFLDSLILPGYRSMRLCCSQC